jgi:hypothetical protein
VFVHLFPFADNYRAKGGVKVDKNIQIAFERLLELKKEYEDKLVFAQEENDIERIKHYKGACEGLTVAVTAFAPYFANK